MFTTSAARSTSREAVLRHVLPFNPRPCSQGAVTLCGILAFESAMIHRSPTSTTVSELPSRPRIILCVIVFVLSVGLGVSIGYSQRSPEFNATAPLRSINNPRIVTGPLFALSMTLTTVLQITLGANLVAVDATVVTMTIDWFLVGDTAIPSRYPGVNPNSTVDLFFDA